MTASMSDRRQGDRGRHISRLAAYVLLVMLMVFGFHRINIESYQRCQATNANARALRELVIYATRNTNEPVPVGTPESVIELIRRGREQAIQLRSYTTTHVKVQTCVKPWPN
jgi:hypothetical protein